MTTESVPLACGCERSDAWRCAVARVLPTVSCHCSCHRSPPADAVPADLAQQAQRIDDAKGAQARILAGLDLMNCHGVASAARGQALTMLIPPTRMTQWTPEQALVLAAWLVSMAEPFAGVSFAQVLHKVQST